MNDILRKDRERELHNQRFGAEHDIRQPFDGAVGQDGYLAGEERHEILGCAGSSGFFAFAKSSGLFSRAVGG